MTDEFHFEQRLRETRRWYILRVLDAGRPIGASEEIIASCLADSNLVCNRQELRRDLDYLRGLNLIEVDQADDTGVLGWYGRLLPAGTDVVEYNAPAPAGIARPSRREAK